MNTPHISVVIPAYNAAWCVARAIDSVLSQTWHDYEVIVINDGSTDETAAVLSGYRDRINVLTQKNAGLSAARNAGIAAARGEWIAFLDADDWWLPAKLDAQVELVRTCPNIGFCSTAALIVSPEGKTLERWDDAGANGEILRNIFVTNATVAGSGSAVMARRSLFDQIGGFDTALRSLEDIDMWMRLAAVARYACVREPMTCIVRSPGSMSRNREVMRSSAVNVMTKNRDLLGARDRGAFWRMAMAGVLADYAKWRYRDGERAAALFDLAEAFALAPVSRGRLLVSLALAMLGGRKV
ncbi:MAG: glycosyltransferase family A protein [Methyloversatilis sp.]|nr:glycosyltransferase family A protein [Methyloversatilis sp.]